MTVTELYEDQIKHLSLNERLQIAQWILKDLAPTDESTLAETERPKRSLLELEGLGAEIWKGVDAQSYVDRLRSEWDHRT